MNRANIIEALRVNAGDPNFNPTDALIDEYRRNFGVTSSMLEQMALDNASFGNYEGHFIVNGHIRLDTDITSQPIARGHGKYSSKQ